MEHRGGGLTGCLGAICFGYPLLDVGATVDTRRPSLKDVGPPSPTERQYRRVAGIVRVISATSASVSMSWSPLVIWRPRLSVHGAFLVRATEFTRTTWVPNE